jgi:hypothetical protein
MRPPQVNCAAEAEEEKAHGTRTASHESESHNLAPYANSQPLARLSAPIGWTYLLDLFSSRRMKR